jgi:hypothetical protein
MIILDKLKKVWKTDAASLSSPRLADRLAAFDATKRALADRLAAEEAELHQRVLAARAARDAAEASAAEAMRIELEAARTRLASSVAGAVQLVAAHAAKPGPETAGAFGEAWRGIEKQAAEECGEQLAGDLLRVVLGAGVGRAAQAAYHRGLGIGPIGSATRMGLGRDVEDFTFAPWLRDIESCVRDIRAAIENPRAVRKLSQALEDVAAEIDAIPDSCPKEDVYADELLAACTSRRVEEIVREREPDRQRLEAERRAAGERERQANLRQLARNGKLGPRDRAAAERADADERRSRERDAAVTNAPDGVFVP